MFANFKSFVENKISESSSNIGHSAVAKVYQAEKSGQSPFDVQFAAGALRKNLGLDDTEIAFLVQNGVIVDDGNGFKVLDRNRFTPLYKKITGPLFMQHGTRSFPTPQPQQQWATNPFGQQ